MSTGRVASALKALKDERAVVGERLLELQREIDATAAQLQRLDAAISALEIVTDPPARDYNLGRAMPRSDNANRPRLQHDAPRGSGSRLIEFISHTAGEEGRATLQPTNMLLAVLDDLGEPVSRDRLKEAFFDYFDRETLKTYWLDPDKAFRSALRRAVEREIINTVDYPNGQVVYMSGFREVRPPARPASNGGS
ncbi:hypothetical protein [Mycolicibacterium neoaurum]|uniref:hypothetical protein n=1 Tax=Mycolicibacterium neoaurum TaxID=1795 RepID=UPI001F4CC83C|nr:hypothetical protein [Mycolicibacterium neoaurum]